MITGTEIQISKKFLSWQDEKTNNSGTESGFSISPQTKHIKLLLVEDQPVIIKVHQAVLTNMKYEVVVAKNGAEALEFSSDENIDIILMDIDLPDITGIEATRRIRAENENIPIIAVTSHTPESIWSECEAAGMNSILTKPCDHSALDTLIKKLVKHYRKMR